MQHYDLIVIGFGKAGKTLAAKLGSQGKKVAIIEKSDKMYGGTCINIGCIPTKTLIVAAERGDDFSTAMATKNQVTDRLRNKNLAAFSAHADVYTAQARFISNKIIEISAANGERKQLEGEIILINTGAVSVQLPIEGLATSKNVFDSTGIQQLSEQPKRLGIIGGGNIGLEFAGLYARLGSEVRVFDPNPRILMREEEKFSALAQEYMSQQKVNFELNSRVQKVFNRGEQVVVQTEEAEFTFDALLYATGRKPNTADLGLENTEIKLTHRGAIEVNEFCESSVKNVFAAGDVNGGLQFTYVSLDDFRIISNYLQGKTDYSLKQRQNVPYTLFMDPPFSRVGLNEDEAKKAGINYASKEIPLAAMPRAHVNGDLRGLFKVLVDPESKRILGATLFGAESAELINLITLAMNCDIPYTRLQSQIFTHPTMAENFNDLFAI
ncbi:pyruvate/2-oxoglutarate dehydrogenase complex dihydrolipoamide dehydrogenase (E3) component [Mesocricetibacter intestinalis]|uniref:Pyruvate/2-oxoglutarate dehydrogenase complex dihydrolipoamide dehydrogenase (E3) component n=1 Tax=Mesocricetibacter intestinalis TaxID=1521930 RepID=A0A4R6V7Q9_9PAST|nr:FAD-containing oxidoreductase [Mesocricetibacter intestinalis]TDQ57386.1 pyruvate/2-oxoglutarate dehydrogenase complex dihydrolipoamide dehydrogenase (E3) component [Mesocricetibacter intestinalis]